MMANRRRRVTQRNGSLSVSDRIALAGVVVAAIAAVPVYVVFLTPGRESAIVSAARERDAGGRLSPKIKHRSQIGGGQIALMADLTHPGRFQNPLRAQPCDALAYRVRLYNPGPATVHNVRVAASINTITSYSRMIATFVAYAPDGSVADVAAQPWVISHTPVTQAYVAGSTRTRDSAGRVVATSRSGALADTITATTYGIPVGNLGIGVTEYVEFETKLSRAT